ncbi:amino acid ABC transporter permease [Brachybacterium phenoliresistens]|uniref:Amino acid ABC transporter permease n=1 Tax=Brachybacterium phenoliresistens TaxID=396014 RepID=Z9JT67_9MICO|nr:amino acid ABC transporter permease [Brachybacterium phenoliresistens]EWS81228.1 amino acid ABC transporter permease [Brachybacterium phenoliresistens]
MDHLFEQRSAIWDAFLTTLSLAGISGLLALVLGTVLAGMRVSPFLPLRIIATGYTEFLRNTPLTIVFFFYVFVTPSMGFSFSYKVAAVIALTCYTAAFVAEAVRSGINSVAPGQAEAARSLGMSFGQNLGLVVLPQAFRTAIPPLISVFIALVKNTSVAGAFSVLELFALSKRLTNAYSADVITILIGIALCYLVICIPLGRVAAALERKAVFGR